MQVDVTQAIPAHARLWRWLRGPVASGRPGAIGYVALAGAIAIAVLGFVLIGLGLFG